MFDAISESARELTGALYSGVARLENGFVTVTGLRGWKGEALAAIRRGYPRPVARDNPLAVAILDGEVQDVADILDSDANYTREVRATSGYRSMLVVPMMRGQNAIGAICVFGREVSLFQQSHIDLLKNFAAQAVIAIENARLFNETQEALERQTATADILKVIARSPSDVQPVFEAIAASAKRLIGGYSAAVHRVIDDVIHLVAVTPVNPEADAALKALFPLHLSEWPLVSSMQEGETEQIADAETADPQYQRLGRARGWRSVTQTPLMSQGKFIGFIACTRREPGLLADHHVQLLRTFADQAVIAIENTRLFNETREALERQTATAEVLQVISSSISNATPVFERILESTERLITCDNANIFLAMPDEQLHLAAFRGPGADAVRGLYPRPLAQTTAPAVIAARRQIVYEDVANHPDVSEGLREAARGIARGTFSAVMTPLMWEGDAIGMLNVSRDPAIKFNEKELSLLRTFADQAVIAIQNARLFNEVQAKTRDLTESLQQQTATADVLKVISRSAFDLEPALIAICETAARLCEADDVA
ncbi:MAG: GAF domain-containing protein, partial [Burkholderiales bacterium]